MLDTKDVTIKHYNALEGEFYNVYLKHTDTMIAQFFIVIDSVASEVVVEAYCLKHEISNNILGAILNHSYQEAKKCPTVYYINDYRIDSRSYDASHTYWEAFGIERFESLMGSSFLLDIESFDSSYSEANSKYGEVKIETISKSVEKIITPDFEKWKLEIENMERRMREEELMEASEIGDFEDKCDLDYNLYA